MGGFTAKDESQKKFMNRFQGLLHYESAWQAWSDFVELSAISISESVDHRDERQKQHRQIVGKYDKNGIEILEYLFNDMVEAMDANQEQDFLGDTFMRLELGSHFHGQFFTPYNVGRMMASMQIEDTAREINENGWASVNDCACGAGALLVAMRNAAKDKEIDWPSKMLFVGQDISRVTALMCYIQLSLMGCAGYVVIADTLRNPITGHSLAPVVNENQDIWFTPVFMLNPVWPLRSMWERIAGYG